MRIQSTATLLLGLLIATLFQAAPAAAAAQNAPAQPRTYLEREVRHQLVLLPFYTVFDNLKFQVNGNTVTLMGEVVSPGTLKSDAENAVKHVEGVEKVINNIKVLPVSPSDDQIRRAEYRAIFGDPNMLRYAQQAVPPIHIIVENGHVTLVGVVRNEMDKNIAGLRAQGVSGTFSVDNQLQVEKK